MSTAVSNRFENKRILISNKTRITPFYGPLTISADYLILLNLQTRINYVYLLNYRNVNEGRVNVKDNWLRVTGNCNALGLETAV